MMNKNIISRNDFEKEIAMCRDLYKKNKKCNWGECEKCGVVPLLWKLHKGELIEDKKELESVSRSST